MPANYLFPSGEPVAPPIVNKTVNKTVNVFHPKPEHDFIDDIGRSADAIRKIRKAYESFNPFANIPYLPVGGMGERNPGGGAMPEPFEPIPFEPPIIV